MTSHPPFQLPAQVSNTTHPHTSNPLCSICNKFVSLESAKTDEHGRATHENCYFLKLNLNHRVPTGLDRLWRDDEGQDIAEYAVMLAVILVIVVGTIRLIGSNSNNVFSSVSSSLQ
jgi:Flp pilus assembly pilin Flp